MQAGLGIPQPYCAIQAAGCQRTSACARSGIGTVGDAVHPFLVALERVQQPATACVP